MNGTCAFYSIFNILLIRTGVAHVRRDLVIVAANNSNVTRLCLVFASGSVRLTFEIAFYGETELDFLRKTQRRNVCRKIKSIFKPCKFALCVCGCGAVSLLSAAAASGCASYTYSMFLCLSRIRHVVCRNAGRHLTKRANRATEKRRKAFAYRCGKLLKEAKD